MRKFTSLMLMLLCAVATFAQSAPKAGCIYRIKHVASDLYFTTADFTKTGGEGAFTLQSKVEDPSQLFTLVPSETAGQFYLKQTKDETEYYVKAASWNFFASTTDKTSFTISLVDGKTSVYTLNQTQEGAYHGAAGVNNTAEGSSIYNNKSGDNAKWSFEYVDVEFSTVTVVYNFMYEGVKKYTQTTEAIAGENYPDANIVLPFGVSATAPEEVINAEDATEIDGVMTITKEIELTVSLPFEYYNSYNEVVQWYYVNVRDVDPTYMYYDSSIEYIKATAAEVPSDAKDAYSWAFIGNPFDGFKIVNLLAGSEMVLSSPATPAANQDASQIARMVTEESATGNTDWDFIKPTHANAAANGFYIQHPTAPAYALNRQDYNGAYAVCYWNARDTGSAFQVVARPTVQGELEALIAEYEAKNIVAGTNPGEYTEAAVAEFNTAFETAKAVTAATQNDIDALVAAYNNMAVNPVTEGLYIIVNAKPAFAGSKVLTTHAVCGWYGTASTPAWEEKDANDPLQYFEIEQDGENFYLKSAYEGSYVTSVNTLGSEPVAATFTSVGNAQFNITIAGGVFHANLHQYGISSSNILNYGGPADSPSAWKLVKVEAPSFTHTLTVSDAGYATLMLAFDAEIPAGVECYYATATEGDVLKLAQVEGNVLPANTPVIVKAAADDYAFTSTDATATAPEGNLLSGTLYTKNVTPAKNTTYYVLANGKEGVGLYPDALSEGIFRNNANKAYLPVVVESGSTAPSYSFNFDWAGTTAIEGVTAEGAENGAIYDITGRRVKAITAPGIYIVNGKKVVK